MENHDNIVRKYKSAGVAAILWVAVSVLLFIKVLGQNATLSKLTSEQEAQLEKMHSTAYDQGYVSAIMDVYLDKALYRIVEENDGPSLWRKTEIDPVNLQKLLEDPTQQPAEKKSKE